MSESLSPGVLLEYDDPAPTYFDSLLYLDSPLSFNGSPGLNVLFSNSLCLVSTSASLSLLCLSSFFFAICDFPATPRVMAITPNIPNLVNKPLSVSILVYLVFAGLVVLVCFPCNKNQYICPILDFLIQ